MGRPYRAIALGYKVAVEEMLRFCRRNLDNAPPAQEESASGL